MAQDNEAFLSRWSRRKLKAEKEQESASTKDAKRPGDDPPPEAPPGPQARAVATPGREAPARAGDKPVGAAAPATELPSLDKLTSESEFGDFMKPGVDDKLRRSALKKLFADPRFNVIDYMDVYIDDYSINDPIPPEMLKNLAHARRALFGAEEDKKEESGELAQDKAPEQAPQQIAQARDAAGSESQDGREAQRKAPERDAQGVQSDHKPQSGADPDAPAKKG
jgi:hypothetical protein